MMNAQICHSQIGAEIRMPIANDMRRRRSKAPVTVLNISSTLAESPSVSAICADRLGDQIDDRSR